MNILILGSGGREHALAWKLSQSDLCGQLFIAPGNGGTEAVGTNVPIQVTDFEAIASFCKKEQIALLIPGGEDALVAGLIDDMRQRDGLNDLLIFGPEKRGAMLEGSKAYAKKFMIRHGIPTAAYGEFNANQLHQALAFLEKMEAPYVLKADGLAAGKGVVIPETLPAAKKEIQEMLDGKFGKASATVVIEEFLKGIEVSMFVVTDGKDYLLLPEAKDYKRIGIGDTGPNTGGMGAVSPVPFVDREFMDKVEERIIKPTVKGLQNESIHYTGFIFFGLMNVNGDPYVIEYNVRMGDPETEAVLPRINNDLLKVIIAACKGELNREQLIISPKHAATIVCVSSGYPGYYEKGKEIKIGSRERGLVFHSGTQNSNGRLITNGGRVFAITSIGDSLQHSLAGAFEQAENISFEGKYYRTDIGQDLLNRSKNDL